MEERLKKKEKRRSSYLRNCRRKKKSSADVLGFNFYFQKIPLQKFFFWINNQALLKREGKN